MKEPAARDHALEDSDVSVSSSLAGRVARSIVPRVFGVVALVGGCEYTTGDLPAHDGGAGLATAGADESDGFPGGSGGAEPMPPYDSSAGGADVTGAGTSGADDGNDGFDSDCCTARPGPSCSDPIVAACVCASEPACCTDVWDEECARKVSELGCDVCVDMDPNEDGCCTPHASPGCGDTEVQACVCGIDPYCCESAWDHVCVDLMEDAMCGVCSPSADESSCCEASEQPGCPADPAVEMCVCDVAPQCCDEAWTQTCAALGATLECATCAPSMDPPPQLDCCAHGVSGGCEDDKVEACVCGLDPFCCQKLWDSTCVAAVEAYACGTCSEGD